MQSFQAVGCHQDRGSMYKKIGNSEESIGLEYKVQVEITEICSDKKNQNTVLKIILKSTGKWYLVKVFEEWNAVMCFGEV